jgi:hypothetical protein
MHGAGELFIINESMSSQLFDSLLQLRAERTWDSILLPASGLRAGLQTKPCVFRAVGQAPDGADDGLFEPGDPELLAKRQHLEDNVSLSKVISFDPRACSQESGH